MILVTTASGDGAFSERNGKCLLNEEPAILGCIRSYEAVLPRPLLRRCPSRCSSLRCYSFIGPHFISQDRGWTRQCCSFFPNCYYMAKSPIEISKLFMGLQTFGF